MRETLLAFVPLLRMEVHKGAVLALPEDVFEMTITQRILADAASVGLLRGTVNPKGEDMVNIGAIMEYGATIPMPNGGTITIPPRLFLHPTLGKYRDLVLSNYKRALKNTLS